MLCEKKVEVELKGCVAFEGISSTKLVWKKTDELIFQPFTVSFWFYEVHKALNPTSPPYFSLQLIDKRTGEAKRGERY